jgi:hypothetical protein
MKNNEEHQLVWNKVPVLTTKMLAERLGIMEVNVRMNLMNNLERYTLGKDYFVLKGTDLKALKGQLRKLNLLSEIVSANAKELTLYAEGGAYNQAKSADTNQAWEAFQYLKDNYFRQREALKAIKEAHEIKNNPLFPHTTRPVQVENAKAANKKSFEEGGRNLTVEYNFKSCLMLTGKTPKQLIEIGKKQGLKTKQRSSAKEVCRNMFPVMAAKMSISDGFYTHGVSIEESTSLSNQIEPALRKMYEVGMLSKAS